MLLKSPGMYQVDDPKPWNNTHSGFRIGFWLLLKLSGLGYFYLDPKQPTFVGFLIMLSFYKSLKS